MLFSNGCRQGPRPTFSESSIFRSFDEHSCESILTLYVLHIWGARSIQGTGEGAVGDKGITWHGRAPGSHAGKAGPPMTFREAACEQSCSNSLKRKWARWMNEILSLNYFNKAFSDYKVNCTHYRKFGKHLTDVKIKVTWNPTHLEVTTSVV